MTHIKRFLSQFDSLEAGTINSSAVPHPTSPGYLKTLKFHLSKWRKNGNWIPFHKQFMTTVDSNQSVPIIQKFIYLKSAHSSSLICHCLIRTPLAGWSLWSIRWKYRLWRLIPIHVDLFGWTYCQKNEIHDSDNRLNLLTQEKHRKPCKNWPKSSSIEILRVEQFRKQLWKLQGRSRFRVSKRFKKFRSNFTKTKVQRKIA